MSIISQYEVSYSNPSTVGGASGVDQYFNGYPGAGLWNVGAQGMQTSAQLVGFPNIGSVPTATSSAGSIQMPQFPGLNGARFKLIASGYATASASTPTITPFISVDSTPSTTATYGVVGGGVASNATVSNKAVAWNIVSELFYSPIAGTLAGYMSYHFANAASGGTDKGAVLTIITPVTGLAAQGPGSSFGFVCGIQFSAGTTGNSAKLTQFQLYQD